MTKPTRAVNEMPVILVFTVAAAGLGLLLAVAVDWQLGAFVFGLALLGGAGLRLALPLRSAGWLAVRTKGIDATVLLALGFAVVVLANTIPRP